MSRPVRTSIINELGNRQTLPDDKGQYELIPGNSEIVFMGLGPEPQKLTDHFPEIKQARYIETSEMQSQINGWEEKVPLGYTPIKPEDFSPEVASSASIIRYLPGLKAFPSFWGPLTARTVVSKLPSSATSRVIWMPSREKDLLDRELTIAFGAKGYRVRILDPEMLERSPGTELPSLLTDEKPELFFSINFKGLEPFGLAYSILREAGVKVAIWMVDNPFNILTSVKSGYWKEAKLFVTDHSFIGPLISLGASWVNHLPLAACPEFFSDKGELPLHAKDLEDKLVFVGRSEFPQKDKFFAGLTPNHRLLEEAVSMLERGERPNFHWWQEHILAKLWPGNEVRHPGCGAEVAGHVWRSRCLGRLGEESVIFGDDKWGQMPNIKAETRSVLDYYMSLPAVYRTASACLNITGMQLPAGLTQRHFDVWCAGGFLITDSNPGLRIFPEDLVNEITFTSPDGIIPLFDHFRHETPAKEELRIAWRSHISKEHTYHNRVVSILKALDMQWTWDIP